MKLAIISTMMGGPWGGSEELWVAMASEALKEGIEIAILKCHWPSLPPKVLELQKKGAIILQYTPPASRYYIQRIYNRVVGKILSPFKDLFLFKPDMVCISQGATYDSIFLHGLTGLLYTSSIPYVVVCHNNDEYLPDQNVREAAIKFFSNAYRVVFVAHQTLKTTERQLASTLSNAIILRNPVNLCDLTPVPWPSSQTVCIANIGHLWVKMKGQDILFEVLGSATWRSRDWRLRLYGEGPDKRYLEILAQHFGISKHVEFMGYVSDVRTIWSENHLLVLPSRVESAPLAMVEAMLCGRPCVATDVGGITEWLEERKTGYIASAPTVKSFGAALERAWLGYDDWRKIGIQANNSALSRIDPAPGKTLLQTVLAGI